VHVNELNLKQHLLLRYLVSYKHIDTVCGATEAVNYPTEFLNLLDLPGKPPHNLHLKVGSPIILFRNLNLPRLYSDTRLVIKKLMKNVIETIEAIFSRNNLYDKTTFFGSASIYINDNVVFIFPLYRYLYIGWCV
jgi:hypothetical protein